jgi:hypothetical protein
LTAENVNGPAPFAGVTLTIPLQVVVLSVNPAALFDCAAVTTSVGEPDPAAENARLGGDTLTPVGAAVGVAVDAGAAVAVGVTVGVVPGVGTAVGVAVAGEVVGLVVGAVVGSAIALTVGVGLDDPPPPQATRETAATPAKTKIERNLGLTTERTHTPRCALHHTPMMLYDACRRRETFARN